MKPSEAFAKAFFYTKLGWGNYIAWWLSAIAYNKGNCKRLDYYSDQANKLASLYTFDIYKKNLLGLIEEYLKFKKA